MRKKYHDIKKTYFNIVVTSYLSKYCLNINGLILFSGLCSTIQFCGFYKFIVLIHISVNSIYKTLFVSNNNNIMIFRLNSVISDK